MLITSLTPLPIHHQVNQIAEKKLCFSTVNIVAVYTVVIVYQCQCQHRVAVNYRSHVGLTPITAWPTCRPMTRVTHVNFRHDESLTSKLLCLYSVDVMNLSEWPIQMMVASSVLHAIADIICLINIAYSVSILYRLLFVACTDTPSDRDDYRSVCNYNYWPVVRLLYQLLPRDALCA